MADDVQVVDDLQAAIDEIIDAGGPAGEGTIGLWPSLNDAVLWVFEGGELVPVDDLDLHLPDQF